MTVTRMTLTEIGDRVRTTALAVALAALTALALPLDASAQQPVFGDDFGIVPGSFFAGTCDLPPINVGDPDVVGDPSEDPPEVQVEKRDCHPSSTLAPETAQPLTQAGAHPDGTTSFELKPVSTVPGAAGPYPDGNVQDVVVDLPAGFIGDPEATPKCNQAVLVFGTCPVASQVGIVDLRLSTGSAPVPPGAGNPFLCSNQPDPTTHPQFSRPEGNRCRFPIFNLVPADGQVAAFGFPYFPPFSIVIVPTVRTDGDYGLTVTVKNTPQFPAVSKATVTLWGVPGDPEHNPFRFRPVSTTFGNIPPGAPWPSELTVKPFLINPTSCNGQELVSTLRVNSWQKPNVFDRAESVSPPVTGCDQVPFDPDFDLQPTSRVADSASGLNVDLTLPQSTDPDVLGTGHLKRAEVVLPEGTTINPAGADGLQGCTDEQLGLHSKAEPTCPEASKIGTVTFDTHVLPHPDGPGTPNLHGEIYLGQPLSNDPESGDMFRLFLVGRNPDRDLLVKLEGSVFADAETGRLSSVFDDNPQVPVSKIHLAFKGGPRGVLAMPQACGTYTTTARLTPWSANGGGLPVDLTSSYEVSADGNGAPCPAAWPFAPGFTAGTTPASGGGTGGVFSLTLTRPDQQQEIGDLSVELPPGLVAKVAGVPLCGDAQAAAGTCPIESRVGTTTVSAGPGPNPFSLTGSVSLTEGYKGAPYGLSVSVRVIAGPFDLGNVVVRQALHIDPTDAHVTAISDPLPRIVGGVPVKLRTIAVDINRPGFMVNPTSCAPKRVSVNLLSTQGTATRVSSPFRVNGCAALPFRPRMSMRLTGRRQTTDGKHPGLRTVVTQRPGQANIKRATVRLPLSLALDPERAQSDDLCEFEAGQRVDCPPSSIIGRARAVTPLLNRPLTGPVYFVKNVRIHPRTGNPIRTLPTLLTTLRGEVALNLRARTSVERGKLVTTFPLVPDAQVSRFALTLNGGRRGILVVTGRRNLCQGRHVTESDLDGQNGKRRDTNVRMATPCPKRRRAQLRVRRARWDDKQVTVSGTINRAAKRGVRATLRCGETRISRTVRPRRGRWTATVGLRGRCEDVRQARLTVQYTGGPRVKKGKASRTIQRGT